MPTVQANEHTIYYDVYGPEKGDPVLLMHGFMQIGRDLLALANSLTAAGYRVILPDLPGYGRSTPPERTFPPDFYHRDARVMDAFLRALGLTGRSTHVMGFSDGGEVALLMPILRPDLCRSVIVWGAIGGFDPWLKHYVRHEMPRTLIGAGHWSRHPNQRVDLWQEEWIDAIAAMVDAGGDISLGRAKDIKCPLLMMVGERDGLNPVSDVERFVNAATSAGGPENRAKVFIGAGHECHNERPDEFISTVLHFLRNVP